MLLEPNSSIEDLYLISQKRINELEASNDYPRT